MCTLPQVGGVSCDSLPQSAPSVSDDLPAIIPEPPTVSSTSRSETD
jgi:hypothetical protein